MKNLNGTEKQISYAKALVNEVVNGITERMVKFEKKGIENLKEAQVARYNEMKETLSIIENSTLTEAGQVIAAIQNYNGGGHTNETFKRIMNA